MRNETGLNLGGFFACFLGVYPPKKTRWVFWVSTRFSEHCIVATIYCQYLLAL